MARGIITYYTDKGKLILEENGDLFLLVEIDETVRPIP